MKQIRYGEVVINSLQKAMVNHVPLNIQDMEQLKTDNRYSLYINQIPNLFNEGMYVLSTRGASLTKTKEIFEYDAKLEKDGSFFFDLKLIFDDFKEVFDIILDNKINNNMFSIRDNDTLIIKKDVFKKFTIFIRYKAYPPRVTENTPMMELLELPEDYLVLVPMYIAAELLKEERPDLSIQYRNQFEAELNNLSEVPNTRNQTDIYGYL